MNNLITQAQTQIDTIGKLFGEMFELQQNRSNYTLEKFVVCQHDTLGRQRKQVLDELMGILEGLNQCVVAYELAQIDIEELQEPVKNKFEKRRNEIKLREKERELRFIELRITGLLREGNYLLSLLEKIPKYTREELEEEEPEYWEKRLSRQATLMQMFGGNMGNVDAILEMYSNAGMPKPSVPIRAQDFLFAALGKQIKGKNE